jgi:catechol 2,3-dioxygenase-like lactoylglutathione lyase family enzyme
MRDRTVSGYGRGASKKRAIMKLNHINLPVSDVAANRDFFANHFGMVTVMELGKNFLAMLVDESGMVLNLSHFDKDKATAIDYHKDLHVGFFVDTVEEVDSVHARIVANGLDAPAPKKREGRYAFYVKAPGGFDVEVACLESFS